MGPILIGMLIFALFHSFTAGQTAKQSLRTRLGDRVYYGFYRAIYNLIAILSILPVLFYVSNKPGDQVYDLGPGWQAPMTVIQGIGLVGFVLSLIGIDFLRFAGIRQMVAYFLGQPLPLPPERLQTRGVYALVRHPLYLFSLMLLWSSTSMTEGVFYFNLAATLYFVFGSLYEERRMVSAYGQEYVDYQRRVPWLIPGLRGSFRRS